MRPRNASCVLPDALKLIVRETTRPLKMGELVDLESALRELIMGRLVYFDTHLEMLKEGGFEGRPWSTDDEEPPLPLDAAAREGLGALTPDELTALAGDKQCLEVLRDLILDGLHTEHVHVEWRDTVVSSIDRRVDASLAGGLESSDTVGTIAE